MSTSRRRLAVNRQALESKIAAAKYMSKPDAENAMVVRDAKGRWIFEVYLAVHTAKNVPC